MARAIPPMQPLSELVKMGDHEESVVRTFVKTPSWTIYCQDIETIEEDLLLGPRGASIEASTDSTYGLLGLQDDPSELTTDPTNKITEAMAKANVR